MTEQTQQDREFNVRKLEENRRFYRGWIAQLDEQAEGAITPSVGGPRITKWAGQWWVDPEGRAWPMQDDGDAESGPHLTVEPPEGLEPVEPREDSDEYLALAVEAAVRADMAAHGHDYEQAVADIAQARGDVGEPLFPASDEFAAGLGEIDGSGS